MSGHVWDVHLLGIDRLPILVPQTRWAAVGVSASERLVVDRIGQSIRKTSVILPYEEFSFASLDPAA